jgi:hypothetical protein
MTATARTFTARSARTTRMRVLVIPTVAFAKPAGRMAKLSHRPRHRGEPAWTGMLTLANGTAERRASEGMLKINAKVTASLPVRTKPMTRPIMWPIFAPSTSRRM